MKKLRRFHERQRRIANLTKSVRRFTRSAKETIRLIESWDNEGSYEARQMLTAEIEIAQCLPLKRDPLVRLIWKAQERLGVYREINTNVHACAKDLLIYSRQALINTNYPKAIKAYGTLILALGEDIPCIE